ncbi:MAG: LytR C-terminal domain-containing protein, partial [Solirubrobacteraceae bacterium]
MTQATIFALSLTHSITEIGAVVAVAGLLAIAVLSLLFFMQGKEIRRLREWAGRAPERAQELAARRPEAPSPLGAVEPAQPAGAPRVGGVSGIRPLPRATPLVTRQASVADSAPSATLAAGDSHAPPVPAATPVAKPPGDGSEPVAPPDQALPGPAVPTPAAPPAVPPAVPAAPAIAAAAIAASAGTPAMAAAHAPPMGVASEAAHEGAAGPEQPAPGVPAGVPAPATAAAIDRAGSAQAPGDSAEVADKPRLEPDNDSAPPPHVVPAEEEPEEEPEEEIAAVPVAAAALPESAGARSRPRFPPTPVASSMPAPAVRAHAASTRRGGGEAALGGRTARRNGHELPDPAEFRFLRDEPRRGARTGVILGAVAALAIVVVVVILATSGSGSSPSGTSAATTASTRSSHRAQTSAPAEGGAGGPQALHVVVLNSTEISGLAHRLASRLQEHGYKHAEAQNGRPEGAFSTSVVEYAPGFS